jgi:hypothetical protein
MIPERPSVKNDINIRNQLNELMDAVKKHTIKKNLEYLSEIHDVPSYGPDIQTSLKQDVRGLLIKMFASLEDEIIGAIETALDDLGFDFESALADNHAIHTRDDGKDLCACED